MADEQVPVVTSTRMVLRKYEGDPPFTEDRLVEAIVTVDDEIVEVWKRGESEGPPPED